MIDSACNYLDHFALSQPTSVLQQQQQQQQQHQPQLTSQDHDQQQQQPTHDFINASNTCNSNASSLLTLYAKQTSTASEETASASHQVMPTMKMEMQYPPQASSTGSASPNSSISQSAASSASVSPSIFPSPAQSLACISSSPLAAGGSSSSSASASTSSSSTSSSSSSAAVAAAAAAAAAADLGAAAVASAAYGWNTATYTSLPTRTQFPYAQYATDYYGNVATVGVAASAASAAWFSHQERLYQPWSSQSYPSFNFDDIAFQTQLQRRSVRCTCPNCTNEMSGLPPIVGPDERGRKQHICHILGCERLYGKASHLKTHLRWHTGERPFLCLTCGKRFSRSDELQRHGRTHTNYRPYACSICSKKFSRSDHLSKHKKTHFKDKKSKKALVAEAKEQSAFIKLEKPDKTLHTNKKIISRSTAVATVATATATVAASMPVSGEQLKQEHPETPSNLGYAPYMNLHLQSGAAEATTATAPATAVSTDLPLPLAPPPPLFQSQHQRDSNRSRYDPWTNISSSNSNNNNDMTEMNHNQTTSESIRPTLSVRSVANSNQTQHYAALAMQSESQLATEYGLTMSGLASGASDSSNSNSSSNNSNGGYASPIGPMKSEFASSYPTEFTNSTGYGYVHHHHHHAAHHTHAHHHHQNAWAAAYHHPHTTV